MSTGKKIKELLKNEEFVPAKKYGQLTPGKALRIYRELQGMTQAGLAKKSGLKQATISSLEHDRVVMGIDRAKALALALKIHPSVLAFADWNSEFGAA
ncbi:MAG: helix-turn-helix transcriptional regulator [Bdellovibrio sp.]